MTEHWTTIESAIARQTFLDEIGDGDPTPDEPSRDIHLLDLLEHIKENGGATLRTSDNGHLFHEPEIEGGFVVAVNPGDDCVLNLNRLCGDGEIEGGFVVTSERVMFDVDIMNFASSIPRGQYFGAWIDGSRLVLDAVQIVEDLETALSIGRANGQDAIWDRENFKEVRV